MSERTTDEQIAEWRRFAENCDNVDGLYSCLSDALDALETERARAVAIAVLHIEQRQWYDQPSICAECLSDWPCATRVALDGEATK